MNNIQPNIDPQAVPGFVLWQVSKLWQRSLASALKPFGIGGTEFVVLGSAVRLTQLGQQVTSAALMEATKIDRMTASQILRSLGKKGLIERAGVPDDKRTFRVMPTQRGVKLADDALGEVIKSHTIFFTPLQSDAGQFLATMQKLIGGSDERAA